MIWICDNCGRKWNYPIEKCIFCKINVSQIESDSYSVIGGTKIFVPSFENPTIPYYTLLLKDQNGNMHVRKTYKEYLLGEKFEETVKNEKRMMVGIIGTGPLGKSLAELFANSGNQIILRSRNQESLEKAKELLIYNLSKNRTGDEINKVFSNIKFVTDISELKNCDLIIEAIIENLEAKKELFRELGVVCSSKTIITSNTSSLSITEMSHAYSYPARFAGMHFFNPVSKMQLVEVVRGKETSIETIESIKNVAIGIGKTPLIVDDAPGFIVNRNLMPLINEAAYEFYEGMGSAAQIDSAIMLGLNHPMGPLALADLIGIDICVQIMDYLYEKLGNIRYKPCPILNDMLEKGDLGRKSGRGFYEYSR